MSFLQKIYEWSECVCFWVKSLDFILLSHIHLTYFKAEQWQHRLLPRYKLWKGQMSIHFLCLMLIIRSSPASVLCTRQTHFSHDPEDPNNKLSTFRCTRGDNNSERELLSRNYVARWMWKIINTGVTTYKCHYNVSHVRFLWNTTPSNTIQYHHHHHSRTAIYGNKLLNNVKSSYGFALWFVNMVFILLLIK